MLLVFPLVVTQNDGVPALVTLKKGLVALARQWMKFIVVTQGFKAIGLMRPNQLAKPKEPQQSLGDTTLGLDNGAALQSDTSADGAEFEFDAGGNFQLSNICTETPTLTLCCTFDEVTWFFFGVSLDVLFVKPQ